MPQLECAIVDAIKKNCPAKEVVGLLVMYLFTTILFPRSGAAVPVHLFNYVEDVEQLYDYNWADAVYEMLKYHIPKCAAWCRNLQESGGNIVDQSVDSSDEERMNKGRNKGKKKMEVEADDNKGENKKGNQIEVEEEVDDRYPSYYFPGCSIALIVSFLMSIFFLGGILYINWTTPSAK